MILLFFSFLMFHNIHLNSQVNLILGETIVTLVLDLTFKHRPLKSTNLCVYPHITCTWPMTLEAGGRGPLALENMNVTEDNWCLPCCCCKTGSLLPPPPCVPLPLLEAWSRDNSFSFPPPMSSPHGLRTVLLTAAHRLQNSTTLRLMTAGKRAVCRLSGTVHVVLDSIWSIASIGGAGRLTRRLMTEQSQGRV